MESINSMLTIFNAIIGIYCIYAAIAGKGAAYKNDYPEAIKEPARKSMRILLAIVGPIALFMGVSEYFNLFGTPESSSARLVQLIGIGVLLALIIGYIVWFRVKYRSQLKNPKIKKVQ